MNNTSISILVGVLSFVGGVIVGNLTAGSDDQVYDATRSVGEQMGEITDSVVGDFSAADNNTPTSEPSNGNEVDDSGVAFVIDVTSLSSGQRAALRTAGISEDTIVVTNSMLACAEAKIGSERMEEIKNGASPNMTEGLSLVGCY